MAGITQYSGIRNHTLATQGRKLFAQAEGALDTFMDDAFKTIDAAYPKFYKMDRASKLGFLASEVLLRDTGVMKRYAPAQVALTLANAHASLDTDVRYFETTRTMASPALFVYTLSNIVAGELCIRHGMKGENAFFVLPAFDAKRLHDYVSLVLADDFTQACVAGWVDVMGEQHDVFLYLAEKNPTAEALPHTAEQVEKLYQNLWNS